VAGKAQPCTYSTAVRAADRILANARGVAAV
jgi:hypothetical protein